jgi:hypothetical protein
MMSINQCARQRIDNGILYVDVDLDCVVRSMGQSIPIKSSKYSLNGSTLTIEVVPDMESILREVMRK